MCLPRANHEGGDKREEKRYCDDISRARDKADVVVASNHWGVHQEVLEYMTEIAHAAIDAA